MMLVCLLWLKTICISFSVLNEINCVLKGVGASNLCKLHPYANLYIWLGDEKAVFKEKVIVATTVTSNLCLASPMLSGGAVG